MVLLLDPKPPKRFGVELVVLFVTVGAVLLLAAPKRFNDGAVDVGVAGFPNKVFTCVEG